MDVKGIGTIVLIAALSACAGDSAAPTQAGGTRGAGVAASNEAVFTPSGNGNCAALRMTETGTLLEDGWHGSGLISFGGGAPEPVTSVTANTGFRPAGQAARGSEIWTVSVEGGTFQIEGNFTLVPGSTPGAWALSESGKITGGTGRFDQASGQVVINGPALIPDDITGYWLGSALGEICH